LNYVISVDVEHQRPHVLLKNRDHFLETLENRRVLRDGVLHVMEDNGGEPEDESLDGPGAVDVEGNGD
jgi:hypothetical protein